MEAELGNDDVVEHDVVLLVFCDTCLQILLKVPDKIAKTEVALQSLEKVLSKDE